MYVPCTALLITLVWSIPLPSPHVYPSTRLYEDHLCFDAAQSIYDRPVPVKVSAASPLVRYHGRSGLLSHAYCC